ncbi:UNVERIFIED_CONTAM: hypothetical protein Sradi_3990400 [Sesamum radiatum]|uniref:Uncharacterized protein n=1 Tax=Sesamum radiatum TaxID=300843 RepID=A0AAW2PJP5_SESRA
MEGINSCNGTGKTTKSASRADPLPTSYGSTEGSCCSISGSSVEDDSGIMPLSVSHSSNIRQRSLLDTVIVFAGSWRFATQVTDGRTATCFSDPELGYLGASTIFFALKKNYEVSHRPRQMLYPGGLQRSQVQLFARCSVVTKDLQDKHTLELGRRGFRK